MSSDPLKNVVTKKFKFLDAESVSLGTIASRGLFQAMENGVNVVLDKIPQTVSDRPFYKFVGEPWFRLAGALNTGEHSDISFSVGDKNPKLFQAHKFILAINSPVFHTMFFGSIPEIGPQVEIKDIEPEAFNILLQYLYTGLYPTNMALELAINVLACSRKYDTQGLEDAIITYLEQNTMSHTVFRILETSTFFELKDLEKHCWQFIDQNTEPIVLHSEFKAINPKTLEQFLLRESLTIREGKLFEAVVRWVQAECTRLGQEKTPENYRSILGDNIKLLRMATMTATEFADGPGKSGLFTEAEIGNILMCICSSPKKGEIQPRPQIMLFSPEKRGITSQFYACKCIAFQSKCSFCTKETQSSIPRKIPVLGAKSTASALWNFQMMECYCQCRIRGRCPAGPAEGNESSGNRQRRQFTNQTLLRQAF